MSKLEEVDWKYDKSDPDFTPPGYLFPVQDTEFNYLTTGEFITDADFERYQELRQNLEAVKEVVAPGLTWEEYLGQIPTRSGRNLSDAPFISETEMQDLINYNKAIFENDGRTSAVEAARKVLDAAKDGAYELGSEYLLDRTSRKFHRNMDATIGVELHEQRDWLVPIGNSGFYVTPNEPVDPRDCERWPDSPFCRIDPAGFFPQIEVAVSFNGCEIAIRATPSFAFFSFPPTDIAWRMPECRLPRPLPEEDIPDEPIDHRGPHDIGSASVGSGINDYCRYIFVSANNYYETLISEPYRKPRVDSAGYGDYSGYYRYYIGDANTDVLRQTAFNRPLNKDLPSSQFARIERNRYYHQLDQWYTSNGLKLTGTVIYTHPNELTGNTGFGLNSGGIPGFNISGIQGGWFERPSSPGPETLTVITGLTNVRTVDINGNASFYSRTRNLNVPFKQLSSYDIEGLINNGAQPFTGIQPGLLIWSTCQIPRMPNTPTQPIMPGADMPCNCEEMEDMLRAIYKTVDPPQYPVNMPTQLFGRSQGHVALDSFPLWFSWFIQQFDLIMGEFPIELEITDFDPTEEGNQGETYSLPNIAETLAELMGLILKSNVDGEVNQNILLRLIPEVIATKNSSIVTQMLTKAITNYLGFRVKEEAIEVNYSFSPDATSKLEKLLKAYTKKLNITVEDDPHTLVEHIQKLLWFGGIIQAAFYRKGSDGEALVTDMFNSYATASDDTDFIDWIKATNDPGSSYNIPTDQAIPDVRETIVPRPTGSAPEDTTDNNAN